MAFAAGGALIVGGLGYTLASWTDTEWVWGGNGDGGGPGVGTSTFKVEQNVTAPYTDSGFTQSETNPGQGLTFTANAISLSPGDATYAAVALRTASGSVAGDVALEPAVPASGIAAVDSGDTLWDALHVRVATISTTATCSQASFQDPAAIIADGPLASTAGTASETLAADSGSTEVYCFEVSLPAAPTLPNGVALADLQGRTVAPAWQFSAESD
jgi:hypothetical protein